MEGRQWDPPHRLARNRRDNNSRSSRFARLPMDIYYPDKGPHGDLPPRQDFAARWHPQVPPAMPHIQLTLLVGSNAQQHYLSTRESHRGGPEQLVYEVAPRPSPAAGEVRVAVRAAAVTRRRSIPSYEFAGKSNGARRPLRGRRSHAC